jgi:hypothetical protein
MKIRQAGCTFFIIGGSFVCHATVIVVLATRHCIVVGADTKITKSTASSTGTRKHKGFTVENKISVVQNRTAIACTGT